MTGLTVAAEKMVYHDGMTGSALSSAIPLPFATQEGKDGSSPTSWGIPLGVWPPQAGEVGRPDPADVFHCMCMNEAAS